MKRYPCKSPRVADRTIEEEAVVVSPDDAMLHNLNEVGTVIWNLADGRMSLEDIAARLVENYNIDPDTALADVERFCEKLSERGILFFSDSPVNR